MKTPKTLKVIGLGGIGGYLVDHVARYVGHCKDYENDMATALCDIVLVDGDKFEHHNSARQHFEEIGNKAEEKARILGTQHPSIFFKPVEEYLTDDNVITNIREEDVVFLCVDNHTTRRLVAERCEDLQDIVLISGGNDETDGNIQVHVRENGVDITPSIMKYHPEIANAEGDNPGENDVENEGCEQQVDEKPQILQANLMAAILMSVTFRNWAEGRLDYGEICFDINNVAMLKYTLALRPV